MSCNVIHDHAHNHVYAEIWNERENEICVNLHASVFIFAIFIHKPTYIYVLAHKKNDRFLPKGRDRRPGTDSD